MMSLSFVDFVCCPGWVGEKGVKSLLTLMVKAIWA